MITIVNVSKNPLEFGPQDYELRINNTVIARFQHNRGDDLSVCLEKAAKAAERARWEQMAEFFWIFG